MANVFSMKIYFDFYDSFSFTTTTLDSANVKLSDILEKKTIFKILCENPSYFHTDLIIFEGLATKMNLIQIQKYIRLGLDQFLFLRPQAKFPRKFKAPLFTISHKKCKKGLFEGLLDFFFRIKCGF
jgi:hypothetical protein